jgi:hypothetical protein
MYSLDFTKDWRTALIGRWMNSFAVGNSGNILVRHLQEDGFFLVYQRIGIGTWFRLQSNKMYEGIVVQKCSVDPVQIK